MNRAGGSGPIRGRGAPRGPTIKDVARLAEVSHMTVSRALNGATAALVATDTRERIEAAARELGYAPNLLARGLVSGGSQVIGIVASDFTNPFIAEVVQSIHRGADAADFAVTMCATDYDQRRELRALDVLVQQRVAGIIVTPPSHPETDAKIRQIADRGMPIVAVSRDTGHPRIPLVIGDVQTGAHAATRHLLDLGHRRIACLIGSPRSGLGLTKLAGFRRAMAEAGVPVDESLMVQSDQTARDGFRAVQLLLVRGQPPTAILAATDTVALGAIGAARASGRRVPDDISVVGFDDIPYAAIVDPPMTTVHQPIPELGQTAAQLLFEAIGGATRAEAVRITLPCSLVVRRSSGPAPVADGVTDRVLLAN